MNLNFQRDREETAFPALEEEEYRRRITGKKGARGANLVFCAMVNPDPSMTDKGTTKAYHI